MRITMEEIGRIELIMLVVIFAAFCMFLGLRLYVSYRNRRLKKMIFQQKCREMERVILEKEKGVSEESEA